MSDETQGSFSYESFAIDNPPEATIAWVSKDRKTIKPIVQIVRIDGQHTRVRAQAIIDVLNANGAKPLP